MKSEPPPVPVLGIGFLKVVSAFRNFFVFLVLSVGTVTVFWKGSVWARDNLFIYVWSVRCMALLLLVPLGFVLVFFRATRFLGGSLLIQASWITGANLWLMSFAYLRMISVFLSICGLTFGALIGVIPTAIVVLFIKNDGSTAWALLWLVIETVVIRMLGWGIVYWDIARREKAEREGAGEEV